MLTPTTPIPTSLRGQIRARVKAHPHWKAFLDQKGILSASAKNADLLEFTLQHSPFAEQIERVLQDHAAAAPAASASTLVQVQRVESLLKAYALKRRGTKPRIRVRAVLQLF